MLKFFLSLNGFFSTLAVILIFYYLTKESYLAINGHSSAFFLDESWFPSEGKFNIVPMVVGTVLASLGAIILALPLGLFSALFIYFYCPTKLKWFAKRSVELYTGIPSVIFGFWGLLKIVPLLNEFHPPGQSLLAGILILCLMIFPIVTLNLLSSFELSCKKSFKVCESLGLQKKTYIWKVLLPSIKHQFIGASLLATGRAIGETMAVLMVCGNIVKVPESLFSPVRTLTANIALEMAYAMDEHRSALFFTGLILLILVSLIFILSEFFKQKERTI